MTPGSLTSVARVGRHVTFGGRRRFVYPATLNDAARLQAWVDAAWERPVRDLLERSRQPGLTPAERDRLLFAAVDRWGDGPPPFNSPAARAVLATPEGMVAFVAVALDQDGFGETEAASLILDATPAELDDLRAAFWGTTAYDDLLSELAAGYEPPPPNDRPPTWGKAVDEVAERFGIPYRDVLDMTVGQFLNARSGGEPPSRGVPVHPAHMAAAAADLKRRREAANASVG